MSRKENLMYSKSHEWVEIVDGIATVGITDYAQDQLGDIVFVNLPMEDDEVELEEDFGDIESVKAVSELISPVTGIVVEVNEEVLDSPELVNEDPYEAWLIKVGEIEETEELLTYEEYEAFIEEE